MFHATDGMIDLAYFSRGNIQELPLRRQGALRSREWAIVIFKATNLVYIGYIVSIVSIYI